MLVDLSHVFWKLNIGWNGVNSKVLHGDKRLSWSLVDQFFVSGGNFLSVALCANYLPLEAQGKLGYILVWYFGSIIINNSAIFQHASVTAPSKSDRKQYLGALAWMQMNLAIWVALVFSMFVMGLGWVEGFSLTGLEVVLFIVYLVAQQLADFSRRTAYIFQDSILAAKLSCLMYTSRVMLLLFLEPNDISTVLVIFIVTSFFSVINTVSILVRMCDLFFTSWRFIRLHVVESKWFIRSGPVIWLWSSLPIFLLGGMIDAAAIAIFFTIRSLSNLGNVAMELLETEFSARLGQYQHHDARKAKNAVLHVGCAGVVLWGAGMLLIVAYGDMLVGSIFGVDYEEYSELLTLLWLSNGIVFLYRLNAVYLRTVGKSEAVMKGYLLGVVMMLLVGIPLIDVYGLLGAAGLVMFGATIILFGQYLFSRVTYAS